MDPSAGILMPSQSAMISPGTSSALAISCLIPSRITVTRGADKSLSARSVRSVFHSWATSMVIMQVTNRSITAPSRGSPKMK